MSAQHTPGPWFVQPAKGPDGATLYHDIVPATHDHSYRGCVASVSDAVCIDGITAAEAFSNANLIAAAPDLLAALQRAERCIRTYTDCSKRECDLEGIRAALAKAHESTLTGPAK